MAVRARLAPPKSKPPQEKQWHKEEWKSLPANLLFKGDRRMEAEGYLSSGYGTRHAIEQQSDWSHLGSIANIWQPNRLKGIQVGEKHGTPYMTATQVFDLRPMPRKWLAACRIKNSELLFVTPGLILVTRSGAVGQATIANDTHKGIILSDDLLRVEPKDRGQWGWVYAYLRAPQTQAMMTSAQYGHIIKHLEKSHLETLPIPSVSKAKEGFFQQQVSELLALRNKTFQSTLCAEAIFESALNGALVPTDWGEKGFSVKASDSIFADQKRFDAARHNPGTREILSHLEKNGNGFTTIREAGYEVWVPKRYKRIPLKDGVPYFDSSDLLTLAPESVKTYADCSFGDHHKGRIKAGWLLMPCSGQVYGIIGSVVIPGENLDRSVFSNHVLRIAPTDCSSIPTGYLLTVLSHPRLGRPLVKALAHGSSVPEIDPLDIENFPIVRIDVSREEEIAHYAENAVASRDKADKLEKIIAHEAGKIIDEFIQ